MAAIIICWTKGVEERLWEVVRDGALGRGSASWLSLARKCCSSILALATFWACLSQNKFYPGCQLERNALFSLNQIQPEPHRQGSIILRLGFSSKSPPSLTNCFCHSYVASHPCFMLQVGLCQCGFDLSSCTNCQTLLEMENSEPHVSKFPGRINLLFLFLIAL